MHFLVLCVTFKPINQTNIQYSFLPNKAKMSHVPRALKKEMVHLFYKDQAFSSIMHSV